MTRLESWKKAFYTHELTTLPNKLALWGKFIDTKVLSGTTPEQIQAITINLQAITYRMQELLGARGNIQSAFLVQKLQSDIRSRQIKMQAFLRRLSEDPTAGNSKKFIAVLTGLMEQLEACIKETLNKTSKDQLSPQDGENFYRLLGAYRGVSEAMGEYIKSTDVIHWAQWKEEKFYV